MRRSGQLNDYDGPVHVRADARGAAKCVLLKDGRYHLVAYITGVRHDPRSRLTQNHLQHEHRADQHQPHINRPKKRMTAQSMIEEAADGGCHEHAG